jgi:exodeoxyribonuclease VIII
MVDVKSTEDASPFGFGRSAAKYRYPLQDGWYSHVLESAYGEPVVRAFAFIAVEKTWPFQIGLYYAEPDDVAYAMEEGRRNLDTILECQATGRWPDFVGMAGAQPLQLPPHARRPRVRAGYVL